MCVCVGFPSLNISPTVRVIVEHDQSLGPETVVFTDRFRRATMMHVVCFNREVHLRSEYYVFLVGGLEHFLFSHILGILIPIDFHIFRRVQNHQPGFVFMFVKLGSPYNHVATIIYSGIYTHIPIIL